MTGIESLNLSAICCASLKFFGTTRCTRTWSPALPFPTGRRTRVRAPRDGGSSAKISSISSLRRDATRRTCERSR